MTVVLTLLTYFHSLTKELPSSKASSNANESIGCYMTLYQNRVKLFRLPILFGRYFYDLI